MADATNPVALRALDVPLWRSVAIVQLSALLLLAGTAHGAMAADAQGRIGGACTYRSVPGTCEIVSVQETPASIEQKDINGGPGYAGFDVSFRYQGGSDPDALEAAGSTHPFRLLNSWYPGSRYLKKYGIQQGKTLSCTLKIIQSGTCSPMIFEFEGVDRGDYFESR